MDIKKIRKAKKITQRELAKAVGVDVSVISKYERGVVIPPPKRLVAILKALQIDTDEATQEEVPLYVRAYESLQQGTDPLNVRLVLLGANGRCEQCKCDAPFKRKDGRPYLEVAMLDEKNKTLDPVKKMVALCPNCYAKLRVLNEPGNIKELREIALQHNY